MHSYPEGQSNGPPAKTKRHSPLLRTGRRGAEKPEGAAAQAGHLKPTEERAGEDCKKHHSLLLSFSVARTMSYAAFPAAARPITSPASVSHGFVPNRQS